MTDLRRPTSIEPRPRDGWFTVVLAVVVALPFVVATARALSRGWLAIGDNGNFLIRSRDVLTSNHPLLGTWSSASIPIGEDVNHPGPLLFDLFALPAKLGGSAGLAIGVLLLHLSCLGLLAWFAWRVGRFRLAAAALAATAALAWTMGSELLYDPWQPHTLLIPLLTLLVLVVAMTRGDLLALPVAAAMASLIIQTHLSYTLLVPPLCLWGAVSLLRRHGQHGVVRPALAALAVVAVCWAQPVADQLGGDGNLGVLAGSLGTEQETIGPALGIRVAAEVLASPPWWARDGFGDAFAVPPGQNPVIGARPNIGGLPSARIAVVGVGALGVLLAVAWHRARRAREAAARAAIGVAALSVLVALVVTVRLPVGGVGVPPHQVRYLWPIAVFATAALVLALCPGRWTTGMLTGSAVVLAALTLPTYAVPAGPQDDADAIPIVRALGRDLDSLRDEGTLLYDTSALRFAEPWTSALLARFQEERIDFVLDDPVWIRQLGSGRADTGAADARVFVLEGDDAQDVPEGTRRVAFVEGIDIDEQRELAALERSLDDLRVVLNQQGEAARVAGTLRSFDDRTPTAKELLAFGELAALLDEGLLDVPDDRVEELERYAELRYRWDRHTVALILDPTPYRPD